MSKLNFVPQKKLIKNVKKGDKLLQGVHGGNDVCLVCQGRFNDANDPNKNCDWIKYGKCNTWYHDYCAEFVSIVDVSEFLCV